MCRPLTLRQMRRTHYRIDSLVKWRRQVAALVWVASCIAIFSGGPVVAAPTVLDFEDLAPGTTVTAQYGPRGALFLNHFLGTDPAAHSGTHVLRSANPSAEIFNPIPLVVTFTSAQARVKLFAESTNIALNGTLTAFDAN